MTEEKLEEYDKEYNKEYDDGAPLGFIYVEVSENKDDPFFSERFLNISHIAIMGYCDFTDKDHSIRSFIKLKNGEYLYSDDRIEDICSKINKAALRKQQRRIIICF